MRHENRRWASDDMSEGSETLAPSLPGHRLAFGLAGILIAVGIFVVSVILTGSGPRESPAAEVRPGGAVAGSDEPAVPTLTLDVIDDLADGQSIRVVGSGFPAQNEVGVLICSPHLAPAEGIDRCSTSTFTVGRTDFEGRATVSYRVSRRIAVGGREVDCAGPPPEGEPTACRLVMGIVGNFDVYASESISFDPAAVAEDLSRLEVTPSDGLGQGSRVAIVVREPGVDVQWVFTQCVTGTSPPVCIPTAIVDPADPSGAGILLSTDGSPIIAYIEIADEVDGHDCTILPGNCGIVARSLLDGRTHSERLAFRPANRFDQG